MSESEMKDITEEFVEVVKSWVKLDDEIKKKNDETKELKNEKEIDAVKMETAKNLADLYTKCHTVSASQKLQSQLEQLAMDRASKQVCFTYVGGA